MNQTKQKEREAYEPPVVMDIAPVTAVSGSDVESDPNDERDLSGEFDE